MSTVEQLRRDFDELADLIDRDHRSGLSDAIKAAVERMAMNETDASDADYRRVSFSRRTSAEVLILEYWQQPFDADLFPGRHVERGFLLEGQRGSELVLSRKWSTSQAGA